MASNVARKRRTKEARAAYIASPLALTPEICDRVVKERGPTFRTTSKGHICNQTGARVKFGQCQNYRLQVANGTTAMIAYRGGTPKEGEGRKVTSQRAAPPAMKVLEWDMAVDGSCPDCPHCHHMVRVFGVGVQTCGYCYKDFKVVEKRQPAAAKISWDGSGYYMCPHCYRRPFINTSGLTTCSYCCKPINAEYS